MTRDLPIACSLGAGDLAERLAAIAEIGAESLLGEARAGDGRLLRFRKSEAVRRRLEEIVAAEAECCSFLDLALREDEEALVLSISAPAGAETLADELAAAFAGGTA